MKLRAFTKQLAGYCRSYPCIPSLSVANMQHSTQEADDGAIHSSVWRSFNTVELLTVPIVALLRDGRARRFAYSALRRRHYRMRTSINDFVRLAALAQVRGPAWMACTGHQGPSAHHLPVSAWRQYRHLCLSPTPNPLSITDRRIKVIGQGLRDNLAAGRPHSGLAVTMWGGNCNTHAPCCGVDTVRRNNAHAHAANVTHTSL